MIPAEFMEQIEADTQGTIGRRAEVLVSESSKIASRVQSKVK